MIRVGVREERRVLAKLDGDPKHDCGGYVLRTTDPIVVKARTPIRIRVEARDNDPITGPKWGRSAELTLIPPLIGAAEAKRYQAMLAERDSLIDLVALAMDTTSYEALRAKFDVAAESLEAFLSKSHDGLRVSPRAALAMRGRLRKAREALTAEGKAKTKATRECSIAALENVLLSVDGSLRALGGRDARTVAKTLSDVAEDGAEGLKELGTAAEDKQAEAKSRVDVDTEALDGGGGSPASSASSAAISARLWRTIRSASHARAPRRIPRAAESAICAIPRSASGTRSPLFGGGEGGKGNPSSPGDPMDDGEPGEESEGEGEAGDQQKGLEELAKEHGGAIGEVQDHLRAAEDRAARRPRRGSEATRQAPARGGRQPPKIAGLKKTLEAAEAASREKVEGMADSLEKLQLGDARERGESSLKAIDEARDWAWVVPGADEKLDAVALEVQKQLDWIDDILKKLRKAASEKAKDKLKTVAPREKGLSDKAQEMSGEGEKKAPLPEHVKDSLEQAGKKMKEAGEKLEQGDGDKALELQKEAQRLLEKARDEARSGGAPEGQPHGEEGDEFDPIEKLDIPKADEHKGPIVAFEPLGHRVERSGQRPNRRRPVLGDARRVVPGRDAVGRLHHRPERQTHAPHGADECHDRGGNTEHRPAEHDRNTATRLRRDQTEGARREPREGERSGGAEQEERESDPDKPSKVARSPGMPLAAPIAGRPRLAFRPPRWSARSTMPPSHHSANL